MLRFSFLFIQLFSFLHLIAQFPVHIEADSLPSLPRTTELYIAGSFNNWNPADTKYAFKRKESGEFYMIFY